MTTDSTQTLVKNLADTFRHPIRSPILHPDLQISALRRAVLTTDLSRPHEPSSIT
ncbi:hypothetical protein ACTPOK_01650 [Streptomyces inhibens]|uniref:hypothetical protein n=1 Tax=Streptomyces inhibens TaxID=2293571 RepID=UPI00402ADBB7